MRRYNWHSAGSLGWPFPMLKYKYILQIKYTEAILSTLGHWYGLKLSKCWSQFKKKIYCVIYYNFPHTFVPYRLENEGVPIQWPSACSLSWPFPMTKYKYIFSNKIYGSNSIKQHGETVMVWNYQNAGCSFKKLICGVFIIIFGTFSFPRPYSAGSGH